MVSQDRRQSLYAPAFMVTEIRNFLFSVTYAEVEITKKKIHRLAYRFSMDFKIYRLAYGFFLCKSQRFGKSL